MAPKRLPPKKNTNFRTLIFIGLVVGVAFLLIRAYTSDPKLDEIPISQVISQVNRQASDPESVAEVWISRLEVKGAEVKVFRDGAEEPSQVTIRDTAGLLTEQGLNQEVIDQGVVEIENLDSGNSGLALAGLLVNLIVPILIMVFLFMVFKSAQGQGSQALGFGRSKARLYGNEKKRVTFSDIAGNANAKDDLEEVVDFLKHPAKFKGVGAKIPKGVLLIGPPGTGKTMIARAVAGEAKVPFYSISGSEFVEMFVGVGASRVRDLFAKAKKNAPCIIFVDEIDAVGRRRGSGMGGGHDEREQTLNQILVEMDGFEQGENVIVLAATNRADVLDPALLRPGRFDRRVSITLPDRKDRLAILKVHCKDKPLDADVDISALAAKTAGSSGADLSNIVNESAIRAARRNSKVIQNQDVVEAFEKVAIGPARKNAIMSEKEKELTAYHEAGHAIVGHVLPESDMVHKVTIVSRGHAGGVTWFLPPDDKSYHSILEFKDVLARMLGGRVAEKVIYGSELITTGAGTDLQKATELARDMIMNQGMGSSDLRNQVFHTDDGMMFDKMMHEKMYSEKTADRIDQEIANLIKEAAGRAEIVVRDNMDCVERLKDALLEKETVEAEEVLEIFKKSRLPSRVRLVANA